MRSHSSYTICFVFPQLETGIALLITQLKESSIIEEFKSNELVYNGTNNDKTEGRLTGLCKQR